MPHLPPDPAAEQTPIRDELAAMRRVAAVLDPLDDRSRVRVVAYFADRYLEHAGYTDGEDPNS